MRFSAPTQIEAIEAASRWARSNMHMGHGFLVRVIERGPPVVVEVAQNRMIAPDDPDSPANLGSARQRAHRARARRVFADPRHTGAKGAASILGVTERAVIKYTANGKLNPEMVEGVWRYDIEEVEGLAEEQAKG